MFFFIGLRRLQLGLLGLAYIRADWDSMGVSQKLRGPSERLYRFEGLIFFWGGVPCVRIVTFGGAPKLETTSLQAFV